MRNPYERPLAASRRESSLEKLLRQALDACAEPYQAQYQVGRYRVDFYLERRNLCLEADGRGWHVPEEALADAGPWKLKRFRKDARKDAYLRAQGLLVLHLPEAAIRAGAARLVAAILQAFPVNDHAVPHQPR
jgi:very-short-patch-repair endonuclease